MRIASLALLGLLWLRTGAQAADTWAAIGPAGGEVDFVAAAPSNPQIVYAASKVAGVFASQDAGATWRAANAGLTDLRIQCLAVSPDDPRIVYAGAQAGGFKTVDGGASWTALGGAFPAAIITSIAMDPSNPATVYGAGATLVKSTNGGSTWNAIGGPDVVSAGPRILAIDPAHTATIYLGTSENGVFRSDDGGATWRASNTGLTNPAGRPSLHVYALAVDPTNPSRLFVGAFSDGIYLSGAFLSTDGGANWAADSGVDNSLAAAIVVASDGTGYFATQQGLYTRPPGAAGWSSMPPVAGIKNTLSIGSGAVPPLYIGHGKQPFDSGGFARWDGGTTYADSYITALVIAAVAADPAAPGRAIVATTGGFFEYLAAAQPAPWNPPFARSTGNGPGGLPTSLFFDTRSAGTVYAGTAGGVLKSTDAGATWVAASAGIPSALPPTVVRCYAALPGTAEGLLAGTSKGLYQTSDGAASWSAGSADLAARQVWAIAPDPASPQTLWAGTDDGVYRSADAGGHWSRAGAGPGGNVRAVLVAPGGRVFAGADGGLFASSDGGGTWLPAPGVSVTVNALIEDPATGALYAGTMAGVFGSADGGASWVSAGEGLANPNIVCLGLLPPGTLLAGSNGSSVFELVRTAAREPVERAGGTPAPRVLPPRP